MKRICVVTTSPLIVNFFLVPILRALATRYRVDLAVNAGEGVPLPVNLPASMHAIPILRQISPLADALALWKLYRLFRSAGFDAVHSFSPKGGLLAMTAAWLARVPVRVHTFTGQVWVTRTGPLRALLRGADRWVAKAATHVLADSPSQKAFLIENRVVPSGRCEVLASGSVSGVDTARFKPNLAARREVREEFGLDDDTVLLLFVGRINRDKGVLDLAAAYGQIRGHSPRLALLFVGPDEENLRAELRARANNGASSMHFVEYTQTPERYLAAGDLVCLPSYREGFGSIVIEAAAVGIPAVGSRIYGLTDAIIDGETGLLHAPGDARDLAAKLRLLVADRGLRNRLGAKARERAIRDFAQDKVAAALTRFYEQVLGT